jgi:hypothetical protein
MSRVPSGTDTLKDLLPVSEIKAGPDDKAAKTLTYKLKVEREIVDVRLWYEPQTLKILKRTLSGKSGESELSLTETYEGLVLDAEIPDEKFKLPKE